MIKKRSLENIFAMRLIAVEEEYQRNPEELKKEDVETIQEWLKTQPHLPAISGKF